MKKVFFVSILVALHMQLYAQTNPQPGYVITNENLGRERRLGIFWMPQTICVNGLFVEKTYLLVF